jgi:DNA repair protein SbcC/Rad50
MRLHALTATGFGPFPGAVQVDFDEVCAAGLFLIHGATGAGKTSLLDAICFALFADVPGARSRRGLASDHASEGTRPTVCLDFTAGGRRLRVERSPEFSRPKRRGTGLTRVPAAVTLEEWTGRGWRSVATRHDEVADVLDQVLGMGLAQFAKVVVLPQGDVSAFLRATPEDRRVLLERLFDISTFTGVEDWLAEERRRSAAEVDDLSTAIARDLERLHDHFGTDDAPDWSTVPLDVLPDALAEHVALVEAAVVRLLTRADDAAGDLALASADLHAARSTAATRERGLRSLEAREAALSHADEITALRATVERATAAEAVSGHLAGLDAAVEDEARCLADVRAARQAAGISENEAGCDDGDDEPRDPQDLEPVDSSVAALAEQLREFDALVSDLVHAAREAAHGQSAVAEARRAVAAAEGSLAAASEARAAAGVQVRSAEERRRELAQLASGHVAAESAFEEATRTVRIATEVAELARAREEDSPLLLTTRDEVLAAQEALIAARQRRLDGMAAQLAAALSHEDPCPVCGSVEHPAPASGRGLVTPEDVESAEQVLVGARGRLAERERTETSRASRIETLLEQLGDAAGLDLGDLGLRRDRAAERLEATAQACLLLPAAEQSLAGATTSVQAAETRRAEAASALAAARATLAAAEAAWHAHAAASAGLRDRHAACPCRVPASEDLDARAIARSHRGLSEAVHRLLTASTRHADAVTRRRDRLAAATRAGVDRGFAVLDDVRSARLPPRVLDGHRSRIAEHDQTLAVTAATLAEDVVAAALAAPAPDLQAAAEAESAARRAVRETQAAHTAAESRLMVLRSVQGPVCTLVERLGRARTRAAAVKELADAATGVGGSNLYRMRLSSFVLAARLEKVVALANERLQRMHAARYLLEHSDARVAGGARSGLDLRVLDQWTGRSRDTASLSGGESFMVSLALALGLADAVREEAGGFDLGTLFVDEGFGSLDEESLEQVMGVLDGLREGGRAVGVVSHVPDLRSRISHQVVVEKTATGSDVTVRTVA